LDPEILFLDNHLLVVNKPAGLGVQPDESKDPSLLDWARDYLKLKYEKPGNVFVGLVHRLDRAVSGVVVLARTSKSAARLSEQFRQRTTRKVYRALAEGQTRPSATLENWLLREGPTSRIVEAPGPGVQDAKLSYRRLGERGGASELEVELFTGRHHQIRVQLAHHGHALLGDRRYGSQRAFAQVALHALSLGIEHPTLREPMLFEAALPSCWPL
jgi:23S rRNA pseudouridine1911/1915/1917 synthase